MTSARRVDTPESGGHDATQLDRGPIIVAESSQRSRQVEDRFGIHRNGDCRIDGLQTRLAISFQQRTP
jgi:hypothetical protein